MNAVLVIEFEPWSIMQEASDENPIPKWRRYGKWSIFILKNKDFSLIDYEMLKKDQKDNSLLIGRIWEESEPDLPTIDYCIAMMTNATKSMGSLGKFEKNEYSQQWRKKYMASMNDILQRLQIQFTINKILLVDKKV